MSVNPSSGASTPRRSQGATLAKIVGLCVLALLVIGIVTAAPVAFRKDPLPLGSPLPAITLQSAGLAHALSPAAGQETLVVLYSDSCQHCRAELNALERSADRLMSKKIVLIAAGTKTPTDAAEWPRLRVASNVTWGRAGIDDMKQHFGVTAVPALYVFGSDGKLVRKFKGETKVAALFPGD